MSNTNNEYSEWWKQKYEQFKKDNSEIMSRETDRQSAALTELQADNRKKLTAEKDNYTNDISAIKDKFTRSKEETARVYDRNIANLKKGYDARMAATKTKLDQNLKQTQESTTKTIDQQQKISDGQINNFITNKNDEMTKVMGDYQNKIESIKNAQEEGIKTLTEKMNERYLATKTNLEQSLSNLDNSYTSETQKLTKDKSTNLKNIHAKSADPFYQMKLFDSQLIENDETFTLTAKIPDHEYENTRVIVDKDRISIELTRRFENQIKEDDSSIKNHSYQSFIQTFPIKKAINTAKVEKTYQSGDLTVKIPKL